MHHKLRQLMGKQAFLQGRRAFLAIQAFNHNNSNNNSILRAAAHRRQLHRLRKSLFVLLLQDGSILQCSPPSRVCILRRHVISMRRIRAGFNRLRV